MASNDEISDTEEKAERQRLEQIVLDCMVHNQCGESNPHAQCMENGRCSKGFPKDFQKQTCVDPDNYYATYRRRSPADGGRTLTHKGRVIDNSWVIPYNPFCKNLPLTLFGTACPKYPPNTPYIQEVNLGAFLI